MFINLQVSPRENLDYESQKKYEVTIRSTDSGQPPKSVDQDLTIHILNVNEPPTYLYLSKNQVRNVFPYTSSFRI